MNFSFTDEQKIFRDRVYRYAKEEIASLSEEADLKGGFSFEMWKKCSIFRVVRSALGITERNIFSVSPILHFSREELNGQKDTENKVM